MSRDTFVAESRDFGSFATINNTIFTTDDISSHVSQSSTRPLTQRYISPQNEW